MKKIWFINHYAIPPNETGSTRTYMFANELNKNKFEVEIFASDFNHYNHKKILNKKDEYNGIGYNWIRTNKYKGNGLMRIINILLFTIKVFFSGLLTKDKPDVIIASSPHPFSLMSALLLSKFKRAKFIVEIRDLWPETLINMGVIDKDSFLALILHKIEELAYKKSDEIVTLLPGAHKYISRYNIPEKKIHYISNGVSIEKFDNNFKKFKYNIREKFSLRNKFIVTYTGSHGKANKLDVIIEAAKKIQNMNIENIHFLFIGDGAEKENLISLTQKYNLKNVTFGTSVNKKYIPDILKSSDLSIVVLKDIDLYKYGISLNKIFDYLASGTPVVFSGNPYNDIIADANAGFSVSAEDSDAIVDSIVKMFKSNLKYRKKLGQNGRKYLIENFEIENLGKRLVKIIENS
jgi:glycosyltransferase involved in cell wall biosynthesis